MLTSKGPFQIIENDGDGQLDHPIESPRRKHDCPHYTTCLNIGAALNWDSFSCRGCEGTVNENLLWRALQAKKRDRVAERICDVPQVEVHGHGNVHTVHASAALRAVGK